MTFIWNWILDKAKDYILKNWKTTLVGVLGAILSRYIPNISEADRNAILAAVVAAVAALSKDGDKTGTTARPRETPASAPVAVTAADDAEVERLRSTP